MKTKTMQNNIPNRWQQTKLGKIPSDWWIGTIQNLVDNGTIYKPLDGNHGNIHPKSSDFIASGIPFVMANDIYDEKLNLKDCVFISKGQADKLQKGFSKFGDVLLTHKGSVGGTAIVPELTTPYVMLTPQVTYYRVKKVECLHPYFLLKFFQSNKFQALLASLSGGGTRAYIGISAQRSLPIFFPSFPEQNRIVAVLEAWDKAIEKLTKKIEIKIQIKKWLMQELLTGKTRLPGFKDEWEMLDLGKICKITTGKKDVNEGNPSGLYPFFTCAKEHTYSDHYSFNTEAVLIAGNGEVGNCLYYNGKFEAYQRTYVLSDFKCNVLYVFPYLGFFFQNIINSQKQMGAMPYIKLGMLKGFQIKIPKSKEEQSVIASVITAADKETIKLEKKLSLLKNQKKYLLNNLITGAIRTPETLSTHSKNI